MIKTENFFQASRIFSGTAVVLLIFLSLSLSFTANGSIHKRTVDRNSSGWFVLFHTEYEKNFTGEVTHLHIYEGQLQKARNFTRESIQLTFSLED